MQSAAATSILTEPMDGFFVWTKRGKAPRFHHTTYASAQAEADRLAALNPGAKFIVMAAVSKHSVRVSSVPEPERPAGEGSTSPAGQSLRVAA